MVSAPERHNHIGLSPSYGYGVDRIKVDTVMRLDRDYRWNDYEYRAFHLPGHCRHHVGYSIKFRGRKLLLTGDYFFAEAELSPNVIVVHNESDEGRDGYLRGLANIVRQRPDILITGHSSAMKADPAMLKRFRKWLLRRRELFQALAGDTPLRKFLMIREGNLPAKHAKSLGA